MKDSFKSQIIALSSANDNYEKIIIQKADLTKT